MAGLNINLLQWIFPETGEEKRKWFSSCKKLFEQADSISRIKVREAVVQVDGKLCYGRVRVPERPEGCVIILNPIDSSKEELFTYEADFARMGFATLSFDGPGQGETYVFNQLKATRQRVELFVNQVIDYAADQFPELGIFLFGTSSGAAWAIQGSRHPKVKKAVSVSPACETQIQMPDYFKDRMSYIQDDHEISILPAIQDFERCSPILLFHGNKDVMVRDEDMYELYSKLPKGKRLIEYEEEGHCCNYKLGEIRSFCAQWYKED
jgi:predicted esterase